MATETSVLGLELPVANDFYDVEKFNSNFRKIDANILLALAAAAPYSTSQTYALGAYCTQGGKLYKCTTAITSAETWTAAHWTETTMGAELIAISIALANKVSCTPPTEHELSLYDGFTANGKVAYFKTQDGIVHCYGSVGGNFTAEVPTQFTVLPVGFRPTRVIASPAACRNTNGGGIGAAVIDVTQTSLGGYIDVITSVNANYIYFATSFVAAES